MVATSAAALATPLSAFADGGSPRVLASLDGTCQVDADLVSWWPADGDGRDQKGGNDGALTGVSIVAGVLDGAFGFDGEDDFVEVPDDSSLQLESGDFTIALWARFDGSDALQYDLLEKMFSADGSVASGFILHIHNDVPNRLGALRLCMAHADLNGHRCYDAATNVVDGEFHHVAVTRTGLDVRIYVDGEDDGTAFSHEAPSTPGPPVSLLIGKRRSDMSFMAGVLDDIRFFDRALADDEVQQLFRCAPTACVGNCDLDAVVTVSELIQGVNIAIGALAVSSCPAFDANRDGIVVVNELVAGVSNLLFGCGLTPPPRSPTPSPTPTSIPRTPTATPTLRESACGGAITSVPKLCNLAVDPSTVSRGSPITLHFCISDLEGDIDKYCIGVGTTGLPAAAQCYPRTPGRRTVNGCVDSDPVPTDDLFAGTYVLALQYGDEAGHLSTIATTLFTVR